MGERRGALCTPFEGTIRPTGAQVLRVTINGESRDIPDALNVVTLLAHLGITPERIAIERNLDILPRSVWQETSVQAGDSYEIVHFVGGG
ncbi:MAG: sulfur carrier protein ThiS [Candidatus Acidiferrales bacterium]